MAVGEEVVVGGAVELGLVGSEARSAKPLT